jgi:hypothetical protein
MNCQSPTETSTHSLLYLPVQENGFAGPTYLPRQPASLFPCAVHLSDVSFFWEAPADPVMKMVWLRTLPVQNVRCNHVALHSTVSVTASSRCVDYQRVPAFHLHARTSTTLVGDSIYHCIRVHTSMQQLGWVPTFSLLVCYNAILYIFVIKMPLLYSSPHSNGAHESAMR